jgi:hypothetical protein
LSLKQKLSCFAPYLLSSTYKNQSRIRGEGKK